jgi:hypothetical protein
MIEENNNEEVKTIVKPHLKILLHLLYLHGWTCKPYFFSKALLNPIELY